MIGCQKFTISQNSAIPSGASIITRKEADFDSQKIILCSPRFKFINWFNFPKLGWHNVDDDNLLPRSGKIFAGELELMQWIREGAQPFIGSDSSLGGIIFHFYDPLDKG